MPVQRASTHLDTVEIGLAAGLEIRMLELPHIVLDLAGIFVDVFDLLSVGYREMKRQSAHFGEAVLVQLPYKARKVGMPERLGPA